MKADRADWDDSKALALAAAAGITTDKTDVSRILAAAGVLEEFLFAGDMTDPIDLRNRRRGVRLALDNMREMARRRADESIVLTDDPHKLIATASKYYAFLVTGTPWAQIRDAG